MHVVRGDEPSGADRHRRSVVTDSAPGERLEEPDRVVLGAIALPIPGDYAVSRPAPVARFRAAPRYLRDRRPVRGAVLSDHRLGEHRVGRDLGQPRTLVLGAEDVQPANRKTSAAHREIAP